MIDLLCTVLLIGYAVAGYRAGLVVSVLSAAGFIAGGALGIWLAPPVIDWLGAVQQTVALTPALTAVVTIFIVISCAGLVQIVTTLFGRRFRAAAPQAVRVIDSCVGAVAVLATVALVLWLTAALIRPASPPSLAREIGQSRVLQAIDTVVPAETAIVTERLRDLFDRSGFPSVFDGLAGEPITPVNPPNPEVAQTPGVRAAAASVIKVSGTAWQCSRGQEGSGWVVRPGQVVTNAHVVAGLSQVRLQPGGTGRTYNGRVVVFDARRDLAVIAAPDLPSPALQRGQPVTRDQQTVVAGFPLDGPYQLGPARVRGELTATGSDIYGRPGVERQIISLRTMVEHGNSGGPLLDTSGRVVGTIFAKSLDDAETGYALSMDEAAPVLAGAAGRSEAVSTGDCTSATS